MVGSVLWDHGIPADSRWYDPVDDPFTQTNKIRWAVSSKCVLQGVFGTVLDSEMCQC